MDHAKLNTFSPDGKLLQLEWAQKATDQSTTSILTTSRQCAVMVSEGKHVEVVRKSSVNNSDILNNSDNSHKQDINYAHKQQNKITETPIYLVGAGLRPDFKLLKDQCVYLCRNWSLSNLSPIPVQILAKELAKYVHKHTISSRMRPFGVKLILVGFDYTESSDKNFNFLHKQDDKNIDILHKQDGNYAHKQDDKNIDILHKQDGNYAHNNNINNIIYRARAFVVSCDGNYHEVSACAVGSKEDDATAWLSERFTDGSGSGESGSNNTGNNSGDNISDNTNINNINGNYTAAELISLTRDCMRATAQTDYAKQHTAVMTVTGVEYLEE